MSYEIVGLILLSAGSVLVGYFSGILVSARRHRKRQTALRKIMASRWKDPKG